MFMELISIAHQGDEDVLERALRRLEVFEADTGPGQALQERSDRGPIAPLIVRIDQICSAVRER